MTASRKSVAVDAGLVDRAERLSVDVGRAAEAGIRSAVEHAGAPDLRAWIEENRGAFSANAERDRIEGLTNESLRDF